VDLSREFSIKTRETGFFRVSVALTKYSRKNPVSDHPRVSYPLRIRRLKPLLYKQSPDGARTKK
jgi:hypothetical protein